jgi:hypothetical protein
MSDEAENHENPDNPGATLTWHDSMKKDNKLPQEYSLSGYVSQYAKMHGLAPIKDSEENFRSRREDFADSVKLYTTDHDNFAKQFPNRAAFIDKQLKDDVDYREGELINRIKEVVK